MWTGLFLVRAGQRRVLTSLALGRAPNEPDLGALYPETVSIPRGDRPWVWYIQGMGGGGYGRLYRVQPLYEQFGALQTKLSPTGRGGLLMTGEVPR